MIVEISVPGAPESIFLVPDEEAEALRATAVKLKGNPGRVWGYGEVSALRASGVPPAEAQKIAEAKMLLHAAALWCRPGKAERLAREAEQLVMGGEE